MALLWVLVPRTYTRMLRHCLYCISEMHSFVNTFLYDAKWIPPLALRATQKNPTTLFDCQQEERRR